MPTAGDAMQQPDAVERQGESEIRFHWPLTIIWARLVGVRCDRILVLQQLLAEGKENTLEESNTPLAGPAAWCSLRGRMPRREGRRVKEKRCDSCSNL
jgi:hypothetical protein